MTEEMKAAIEALGRSFEDFKKSIDARIAEVARKGQADPLLEERINRNNADLTKLQAIVTELETKAARPGRAADGDQEAEEYKAAFVDYVRTGRVAEILKSRQIKANTVGSGPGGGYAVPEDFDRVLGEILVNANPMRGVSNVIRSVTESYVKVYNVHGSTAGWVGETDARAETTAPALAKLTPVYGEVYANVFATQKLLDDSAFDIGAWIANETGLRIATEENLKFTSGNGTNAPKGILDYTLAETADASRAFGQIEKYTTASSGVLIATELIDCVHKLKVGYRGAARWMMPTLTVAVIRKFKDSVTGQFLWQPGLGGGQPPTLLGYPITENEAMPAWTNSAKGIIFGDFRSAYTIADVGTVVQLRDPYTQTPYIRFYFARRVGGFLADSNAIKVIVAKA